MSNNSQNEAMNIKCIEGINAFFEQHTLEETRNTLWKWLNITGIRGFDKLSAAEREHMLIFYSNLQELLEATHECSFNK
jgi:hypothetical protein